MSNLLTIYSPKGEKFEVTSLNYRDLKDNSGWTDYPPFDVAPESPVVVVEPVTEPTAPTTDTAVETPTPETFSEEVVVAAPQNDEAPKARLTVEDFSDLETKEAVSAYIQKTFPDAKIDGRANRDKLIAIAIELANAE